MSGAPVTTAEMDAVLLSRLIGDGERVFIGANLPAPRAGALLASMTTAPRVRLVQSLSWIDTAAAEVAKVSEGMDVGRADGAEAWIRDYEIFDDVRRMATFFVIGGLEIDRHGNGNLLGTRGPDGWARRGPGPVGTTTMATLVARYVLYANRHTPKVFVERCSAVSSLGWGEGGDHRQRLGLSTPGPELCITPAGLFDFPAPGRSMRLCALRPGWTRDRVQAETGFPLDCVDDLGEVEEATPEELRLLRTVIDPGGDLRGEGRRP